MNRSIKKRCFYMVCEEFEINRGQVNYVISVLKKDRILERRGSLRKGERIVHIKSFNK